MARNHTPEIVAAFFELLAESVDLAETRERVIKELRIGVVPPFSEETRLIAHLVRKRLREELLSPGEEGGRLYVLSFEGPVPYVKVGSTGSSEKRFNSLETEARNHCYSLVDGWISAPLGTVKEAREYERDAIVHLTDEHLGFLPSRPSEYFHRADFAKIVATVENRSRAGWRFVAGG